MSEQTAMNEPAPLPIRARPARPAILVRIVVVLLALLGTDQLVNLLAMRDGWFLGKRIAPFDPPIFTQQQQESLARLRELAEGGKPSGVVRFDEELGWTSPRNEFAGGSWYDEYGARRTGPDEVTPEIAGRFKLVLIGCSFTHGDEVAANETWGYAIQCEGHWNVSNLGVGGFGIDQAALLFARMASRILSPRTGARIDLQSSSQRVVLGILPKAIPRLYSVYRPAMRHHEPSVSFKPCSASIDGLTPCENPARTPQEAVALLTTPGRFWEIVGPHDFFVHREPIVYRPLGSHLMHRFATTRLWLTYCEARDAPRFDPSARDTVPDPFTLPMNWVQRVRTNAAQLNADLAVVILPDADDLARFAAGQPALPALRQWLKQENLLLVELEPALLKSGVKAGAEHFAPGGHYSARTNSLVAEQIGAALRGIPPIPRRLTPR